MREKATAVAREHTCWRPPSVEHCWVLWGLVGGSWVVEGRTQKLVFTND